MSADHASAFRAELSLSAALLVVGLNIFCFDSFLSRPLPFIASSLAASFVAFAYLYITFRKAIERGRAPDSVRNALHALFAASVLSFFLIFALGGPLLAEMLLGTLYMARHFGFYFLLLMPLFLVSAVAAYLALVKKRAGYALLLFAVLFAVLVVYLMSGLVLNGFLYNDETFILFKSAQPFLNGLDPYGISFANLLYANISIGVSVTTTNIILGTLQYPALFLLSFVPFYLASPPTAANLQAIDLSLEVLVYLFILIVTFSFASERKDLLAPRLPLLASLALAISNVASVSSFIMIALLMLAYVRLESRHVWVLLGLCLALQEELWLPVLFMLVYLFNNEGLRSGLRTSLLSAVLFLAVSAYFIALGPSVYFSSILSPLSKLLFPNGISAFSFLISSLYPVPLPSLLTIFPLMVALLSLALVYENRKELIPLFSMIPFLFLSHSIISYYALFSFALMFAVYSRPGRSGRGIAGKFLSGHKRLLLLAVAALLLSAACVVVASHADYERNFALSVSGQSLAVNESNRTATYAAWVDYDLPSNRSVFLYMVGSTYASASIYGMKNASLIAGSARPTCGNYTCMLNVNRIDLPAGSGRYLLRATMRWNATSTPVIYASPILYSGDYCYLGPGASAARK